MKRPSLIPPKKRLLTIYKYFIKTNLDGTDIIYYKPVKECFKRKIEMVQYKAALAITGTIMGTSLDRIYQDLGLESLADKRWSRNLFPSTKLYRDFYHLTNMLLVKESI